MDPISIFVGETQTFIRSRRRKVPPSHDAEVVQSDLVDPEIPLNNPVTVHCTVSVQCSVQCQNSGQGEDESGDQVTDRDEEKMELILQIFDVIDQI